MLNKIGSTICIKANIRKSLIRFSCYVFICLIGTQFFTDMLKEQMPQAKLAFGQVLSVIFFIFTLYELFKLCFLTQKKLIISDVYMSWKYGGEQHNICWEHVNSISILSSRGNDLYAGYTYEFNIKSRKTNTLTVTPILDSTEYNVNSDELLSLIKMKSKDYEFSINTIER